MKKSLTFWPLVATILCCVSGGPFGLEPVVQSGVGMAVLLVLLTPIVWSVPAALMTAELSSALPYEGGYYVWVRRALGPFWGFQCGWWSWVYSWIDVASYPVLFVVYGHRLLDLLGYGPSLDAHPWLRWSIGMCMIVPLTLLNIRGTRLVGESSVLFFALILAPFIVLVALGLPHLSSVPIPVKASAETFSAGLFVVMWNYLGWDSLSTVAGEVDAPRRTYPKALAVAVPVVTLVYLLPLLAGTTVFPDPSKWTDGAWIDVARAVGGRYLAIAVAAGGLISCAALFSSTLLAGSRVPFVIAEDKVLPKTWTKVHPRFGTPWVAILVSALFYSIFSFASFTDLITVDVIVYSAALILEFVALVVLRVSEPQLDRPFRIPGGWVGLAAVVILPATILGAAIHAQWVGEHRQLLTWFTAIALATGPAVWFISRAVRIGSFED